MQLDCEPDAAVLQMLAASERQELLRLRQRADRVRYACTRATLRQVLVQEYGCSRQQLIVRTARGKPLLPDAGGLEFNVSHAGAWGLVAVTRAGPLGVDVEQAVPALDSLADYVCAPEDALHLNALAPEARRAELLRQWVAKEAVLKSAGLGVAGGHMAQLCVQADGRVHTREALPFDADSIRVAMLPFADGYCAAVALSSTFHGDISEDANLCH